MENKKDLSWIQNNLIAHRGLYTKNGEIPENSRLSYKSALDKGYSIELDINILKDGTVVAFHDPNLSKLCGDSRLLSEVTYEDIKHLKLLKTKQGIMRLDEVLELVNGKVPLLIELKPFGDVSLLCSAFIKSIKNYKGDFAIFSFHPKVVMWFKKNNPEIIRGQIAEYFKDNSEMNFITKYLMKTMFFNHFSKPDFVSYGIRDLPNRYLDRLMKKGITVISYAARSQKQFDCLKSHYHNVVFEFFEPKK